MIIVTIGGYNTLKTEYTDGLDVAGLLQKLADENEFHYRGNKQLMETTDGRFMATDEPVIDGRYYYLSAMLEPA